jgi:hypothetical protein
MSSTSSNLRATAFISSQKKKSRTNDKREKSEKKLINIFIHCHALFLQNAEAYLFFI